MPFGILSGKSCIKEGKVIVILVISFIAMALLTGVDQAIKCWAVENLKGRGSRNFLRLGDLDVMQLTYLENDGAMFGSFSGMRWILIAVTAALMVFCVCYMVKHKNEKCLVLSMTLIVSGGVGNIIDRLFRGGNVIDYLDIQLFNFAIFNFADCCVTIGAIILLIYIIFLDKAKEDEYNEEL